MTSIDRDTDVARAASPGQLTIRARIRQATADEAQERHRRQVVAMARLLRRAAILHEQESAGRKRS